MFISLSASCAGYACAVRDSIDFHNSFRKETQFFDWLVCSMKSVNEVLEGNKPITFANSDYLRNLVKNSTSIFFPGYDLLVSHHDLPDINANTLNEIEKMTEKYERRHIRLMKTIQQEPYITFVRFCKRIEDEKEEIGRFYENIHRINPELRFTFIAICERDDDDVVVTDNENFIRIYLHDRNEASEYGKMMQKYKELITDYGL